MLLGVVQLGDGKDGGREGQKQARAPELKQGHALATKACRFAKQGWKASRAAHGQRKETIKLA